MHEIHYLFSRHNFLTLITNSTGATNPQIAPLSVSIQQLIYSAKVNQLHIISSGIARSVQLGGTTPIHA